MSRSIILQHATTAQQELLDVSVPINKKYAEKFKFEHIVDHKHRCPDRSVYWEKIAYLKAFLPKTENDSLVVWVDADSVMVGDEDLHKVLPTHGIFGAVQLRGGLGSRQLLPWYNVGFLAMRNIPVVREFLDRVWERNTPTDEDAINAELKHSGLIVGDGIPISGLDIKWNCWNNNLHLCSKPVVRAFHGVKSADKLSKMVKFIDE